MSTRRMPTTTAKITRTTGICRIGPRLPIHWKNELKENPSEVGRASGAGGLRNRKISNAAIRMKPIVTTSRVVVREGGFLPPRSGGGAASACAVVDVV